MQYQTLNQPRSRKNSPSGVTLIELVLVVALLGLLAAFSLVSISSYSKDQNLKLATNDVVTVLNNARSRAINGVDPCTATGAVFNGYSVKFSGTKYTLTADCSTGSSTFPAYYIANYQAQFKNNSTFYFQALSGQCYASGNCGSGISVTIQYGSDTETINEDNSGNITAP